MGRDYTADTLQFGQYESLGMMVWLMSHADYHSQWPLWSLEDDILPPLLHGQYKLYLDEAQTPVGLVTWAWLDEAGRTKVLQNAGPLEDDEWHAGHQVLINDFVALWGHARQIVRDLRKNLFSDKTAFSIGRNSDGSIRKIYHWRGVDYQRRAHREAGAKKNSAGAATPAE